MNRRLSAAIFSAFSALLAKWSAPVLAESAVVAMPETLIDAIIQGKPMTSFRLRYENVNQEGYARFDVSDVYCTTLQNAARKGDQGIVWITGMYTL